MSTFPPLFKPNFYHEYSVVLSHPIDEVFTILGTDAGHERTCRLSGLCTKLELFEKDTVELPVSLPLADVHVRTAPGATSSHPSPQPTRTLPRQSFRLTESVPVAFGWHTDVCPTGTFTWDEEGKVALYETLTDGGVHVWKLREFEEAGEGKTRVKERIEGACPWILKSIVQRETKKSHAAHMELYHTLFQS
ncbi:hypothetical protein EIP91_002152 [Steccherinum ochraceum]|uniref:Uncharacterized protein n=1 Tax=Steccherinum ochraceum TaxID=92696 RepID=A0A4R0RF68_9APHY|nr:hypothetical protein EIP91_002152 [Steccherinum ochraceum]